MSPCRISREAYRRVIDEATWTLTSYLVANGIVLTISGWLGDGVRPQALFSDLPWHVHGLLLFLRHCDQPVATRRLPAHAGILRRWLAADSASDHPRHFSARTACRGIRCHRDRHDCRTGTWADIGGLSDRYLQLALGLFDQYSNWCRRGFFRLGPGRGSALAEEADVAYRFCWSVADHARTWLFPSHAGPWRE